MPDRYAEGMKIRRRVLGEQMEGLEDALRGIWAHNVRIGRARVHRGDLVLVVVWHDGVSLDCWEAVNAKVAEQLVG